MYPVKIEEDYITRNLLYVKENLPPELRGEMTYRQLSLFDDGMPLSAEEQSILTAGESGTAAGFSRERRIL